MKHYWAKLLEMIFPLTDDEHIIASVSVETFTKEYSITRTNGITSLATFKDTKVRAAIHLNKFHRHPHARKLLASLLSAHLDTLPPHPYLLVPIPLSSKREHTRGYNQVTIVAEEALTSFPHIQLVKNILKKQRNTVPQTSLSKVERSENLHGAFVIPEAAKTTLRGAHILLLDDVTTTGTTLLEAKAMLLSHHPASVLCIALAH